MASDESVATRSANTLVEVVEVDNVRPGPSSIVHQRASVIAFVAPSIDGRVDSAAESESADEIQIDQNSRDSATESGASSPVFRRRRPRGRVENFQIISCL